EQVRPRNKNNGSPGITDCSKRFANCSCRAGDNPSIGKHLVWWRRDRRNTETANARMDEVVADLQSSKLRRAISGGDCAAHTKHRTATTLLEMNRDSNGNARAIDRLPGFVNANVIYLRTQGKEWGNREVHSAAKAERKVRGGAKPGSREMRASHHALHEWVDFARILKH